MQVLEQLPILPEKAVLPVVPLRKYVTIKILNLCIQGAYPIGSRELTAGGLSCEAIAWQLADNR